VLDLADEKAREHLHRLIAGAQVFVQNLKPGSMAKLGFDVALLRQRHPGLITCSISGYSETGNLAARKAYDLLIQAESGLCSVTGSPGEPSRVGISIVDIATGATAHAAILEALFHRLRTGQGTHISLSMFDVMADWLTVPLLNHELGVSPRRMGLAHPSIAPYGVFATSDGAAILISVQNDREWAALCAGLMKDAGLATDPRFATNVLRTTNRAETDRLVSRAFARLGRDEAITKLTQLQIAFAEVNDMEGLSRHSELRRIPVETSGGPVSIPAPAPVFSAPRVLGAVPALGQHSAEQLEETAVNV
jgi:crotonobetainyl-CoA:carnitine CoA-transferase CaiB-like acyl-CoA transferase